nr:MAG TPA: hypothetical protein [Caudoviricetes sp.]
MTFKLKRLKLKMYSKRLYQSLLYVLFVRFLSHMVFPHRDKILTFLLSCEDVHIIYQTFVCVNTFQNICLYFFDFIFSYVPSQQIILFSLYFYLAFLT